jgi:hypothetical protein
MTDKDEAGPIRQARHSSIMNSLHACGCNGLLFFVYHRKESWTVGKEG